MRIFITGKTKKLCGAEGNVRCILNNEQNDQDNARKVKGGRGKGGTRGNGVRALGGEKEN